MSVPMRVLMVTREREADRKYGLGKSLAPVIAALRAQGVDCGYVNQESAGTRGWSVLRRLHRALVPPLAWLLRGTDVPALLWGVLERLNMGRLAVRMAAREGWTHLHCHDPLIALGVWLCRPFSGARPRWGVTEHGFGSYTQAMHEDGARLGAHAMRMLRRLEAAVLKRADWVIFPTAAARAQTVRDLAQPQAPSHWQVVPHARPVLPVADRAAERSALGLAPEQLLILGVGRLVPLKAFDLLIRAFAAAAPGSAQLLILGEGDQSPYRQLAGELGVGQRVRFAVTTEIERFYAAADLYVSTSTTESFGMANLEAMLAGLPGIYAAVGGVTEVVAEGGMLLPAGNLQALCVALQRLCADPVLRAELGQTARRRAADWIDAEAVARAYRACYRGEVVRLPQAGVVQGERVQPNQGSTPSPSRGGEGWGWVETTPANPLPASLLKGEALEAIFQPPRPLSLDGVGSVLVIAPHADDETIGCGGTLARLARAGVPVRVCVVSDGRLGDPQGKHGDADVVARREAEARAALGCLGVESVEFLGLPDGSLAQAPQLSGEIARLFSTHRPHWVLMPALVDDHADHVACARAVLAARDSLPADARLLMYEIWTPLAANRIVDIGETAERKLAALQCYRLPLSYVDYLEAARGLMRYRGLGLPEAHGLAEGFVELAGPAGEALIAGLQQVQHSRHRVPATDGV